MNEDNTLKVEVEEKDLTKKERRDQKRNEKERELEKARQSRKTKKIIKWTISIIIIGGLMYWGIVAIVKSNEFRLGEQFKIQSRDHIEIGDRHEEYTTNPPTSGAHGDPVRYGVYEEELLDENIVHNLEHGGIWISYIGISDDEITKLESIARKHPRSVILTPRSKNNSPIAVVSWGRLMKIDTVDMEKIEEYIKQNINKSPEPLAL